MEKVLLIGAGALARDILDGFGSHAFAAIYIDAGYSSGGLGGLPEVTDWDAAARVATHYMIGVLENEHRKRVRRDAQAAGLQPATAKISDVARLARDCSIGPGCMVGHFAVVGPGACLHDDVLIMHQATIAHDVVIEANAVVLPGAWVAGHARIAEDCFIGANANVVPHVRVGTGSHVAAGSTCFRDIGAGCNVIGNPARVLRQKDMR